MKRRERIAGRRCACALAAILAAVACGGGEGPTNAPPGSERLELSVSTSTAEFARGDSVVIAVTLRNISMDDVRVHFENACTIVYGIREAGGPIVVPANGTWACAPIESSIDLDPGQLTQRIYVWKGVSAPAGDYLVFGALGDTMDDVTAGVPVRLLDTAP